MNKINLIFFLLISIMVIPLLQAEEQPSSQLDLFGWIYNHITNLWENWFGGEVIDISGTSPNEKVYDIVNKEITIKDKTTEKEVTKIKFVMNDNCFENNGKITCNVIRGKDRKVAEFIINNSEDYSNVFKKEEFYNLKDNYSIDRQITYKYKTIEYYDFEVPDKVENKCGSTENGSIYCYDNILSYKNVTREKEIWINLDSNKINKLDKGYITIGVFTDVFPDDSVEWIPTLFDTRITEWSSWNDTLNLNLTHYYTFNVTFNDTFDKLRWSINEGDPKINSTNCLIDNCYHKTTGNSIITNQTSYDLDIGGSAKTINFWVYPISTPAFQQMIGVHNVWYASLNSTGDLSWACCGNNNRGRAPINTWSMITIIQWGNATTSCFVNGTLVSSGSATQPPKSSTATKLGTYTSNDNLQANFDEFGSWNRTLSSSELNQLFNNGTGVTYLATAPDTSYPQFTSNDTSYPNNTEYAQGLVWRFNITITSTNGTSGIEFNNINYSMSNLTTSVFNKTFVDLGVGTYSYYYWAYGNGSSTLFNISQNYSYTIVQNSSYNLTVTGTTPIEYGTNADISNSSCPSQINCVLNRNDTGVVTSPDNSVLAVGFYNYTYNTTGNANYSVKSESFVLQVQKNPTGCSILFNITSPQTYPYKFKVYSNCTSPSYITINGTIIANNSEQDLSAGYYNFTVYRNDTQNYTNIIDTEDFLINKDNPEDLMTITGTDNITYPTITDVVGSETNTNDDDCVYSLDKTNRIFGVSESPVTFNYSTNGCVNYTTGSKTLSITINQATPSLSIDSDVGWSVIPMTTVTINGLGCLSQFSCNLYKGALNVTNPYTFQPSSASFIFTYNTTGNANYTSSSSNETLISSYDILGLGGSEECRYKKFGYYNENIPFLKEVGCI